MNESLLYSLGTPSSIYDTDNSDWVASQNLGHDFQNVKAASQERYNRTQERKNPPDGLSQTLPKLCCDN